MRRTMSEGALLARAVRTDTRLIDRRTTVLPEGTNIVLVWTLLSLETPVTRMVKLVPVASTGLPMSTVSKSKVMPHSFVILAEPPLLLAMTKVGTPGPAPGGV